MDCSLFGLQANREPLGNQNHTGFSKEREVSGHDSPVSLSKEFRPHENRSRLWQRIVKMFFESHYVDMQT